MVKCECWACLSDMVVDVFLPWSDVSVGWAFMTRSDISVGWDFLTSKLDLFLPWSNISAEEYEDLHGG